MKKLKYDPYNHGSFDHEWGIHKKSKEWWYATGILFDDEKNMYSYQYTLLHINFGIITAKIAMIALTDYASNRHYYLQVPADKENPVTITKDEASIGSIASAKKTDTGIILMLTHKSFKLTLDADYGKGAFWHCENGKLQMGIPEKKETTLYYSYTNMPTEGTLELNGKTIHLKGKTWFDKQGGTYSITNPQTNWEWFSLRFFDDEEAMLFTFPQNEKPYFDGTFIDKCGNSHRMNDYVLTQTAYTVFDGLKWSAGWKLHMPEKDQDYTIEPVQEGHMNFAYFEEMCYVKDMNGSIVGYAFAELLPGVLNSSYKGEKSALSISIKNIFRKIEF